MTTGAREGGERSAGVLDVRFVNACIAATRQAFRKLLSTELVAGKAFIRTDKDPAGEVTVYARVRGVAAAGLGLSFSEGTAGRVASRLAGASLTPETGGFRPAMARLLAQIAAGAAEDLKGRLAPKFDEPEVAVRVGRHAGEPGEGPRLALPFDSSLGRFMLEIAMTVEPEAAASPAMQTD